MAVAACRAGYVGAVAWRASRQLNTLSRQHDLELGAMLCRALVENSAGGTLCDVQVLSKMTCKSRALETPCPRQGFVLQ